MNTDTVGSGAWTRLLLGMWLLGAWGAGGARAIGAASLQPVHLRCEFRENPHGIDLTRPRFLDPGSGSGRAPRPAAIGLPTPRRQHPERVGLGTRAICGTAAGCPPTRQSTWNTPAGSFGRGRRRGGRFGSGTRTGSPRMESARFLDLGRSTRPTGAPGGSGILGSPRTGR